MNYCFALSHENEGTVNGKLLFIGVFFSYIKKKGLLVHRNYGLSLLHLRLGKFNHERIVFSMCASSS